jgi:hypothetical protein
MEALVESRGMIVSSRLTQGTNHSCLHHATLSPFSAKPKSAMESWRHSLLPLPLHSFPLRGGISYLSLCLSIDCVLFRLPEIVEAEGGSGQGPGWAAHKKASKLYSTWTESRERSGSKIRWIKFEFKYSTSLVLLIPAPYS